jgi:hypothetical protein
VKRYQKVRSTDYYRKVLKVDVKKVLLHRGITR